jgi:hypothetical protein
MSSQFASPFFGQHGLEERLRTFFAAVAFQAPGQPFHALAEQRGDPTETRPFLLQLRPLAAPFSKEQQQLLPEPLLLRFSWLFVRIPQSTWLLHPRAQTQSYLL